MKFLNRKCSILIKNPLLLYTGLFLLFSLLIHCIFTGSGMSYVRKTDGYAQHLPVLAYIGNYIRDYIQQIVSGEGIIPPMYDTGLIQGMDVVGTLHYYGLFEPLNWIAALVPVKYTETLYSILLFVRLYLAGIAFILYTMYIRKEVTVASCVFVTGGLMYAFCGYCTFVGFRHPFFTTGAIMLPLILYGVEKYMKEKKSGIFLWSIALSCVMNFYFAYINSVLMAVYVLVRLCCSREIAWKHRLLGLRNLIGIYILAVGISAFSFIPAVMAFLSNARGAEAESDIRNLFVYPIDYYANILYRYITPSGAFGYWTCLGFAMIVVPCITLMCYRMRNSKRQKREILPIFTGFCVATIMILFPVFGKILNGFAYISNRWTYGYAFVVVLVVIYMLPELFCTEKKEKILMVLSFFVFGIYITIIQYYLHESFDKLDYMAMMIMIVITAALIYFVNSDINPRGKFIRRTLYTMVMMNLAINIYFVFSSNYGGYVEEFLPKGTAMTFIRNLGIVSYEDKEQEDFYRIDGNCNIANSALMFGYNGTGGYYSVISEDFLEYYQALGINGLDRASVLQGFDRNQILNSLSSTRYIQTRQKEEGDHLYGYQYKMSSFNQEEVYLFENQNYIPLGYVYKRCIDTEKFYQYNSMQRQLLLTEAVVLEEEPDVLSMDDALLSLVNKEVYSSILINNGKGTSYIENKKELHIKKKNNSVLLEFNSEPKSLVFFVINGLRGIEDERYSYNGSFAYVNIDKMQHKFFIGSPQDVAYVEKDSIVVPLGYFRDALTDCELQFSTKGIYTYDSMEIVSVPVNAYAEKISDLRNCTMQNTKMENNTISGNISTETEGMLVFSIPYSSGWKAYVNGKEVQVQKANLTYMGLLLEKGNHEIRLRYCTPGIKIGITLSILSFIGSLFLPGSKKHVTIKVLDRYKRWKDCNNLGTERNSSSR